MFRHLQIDDRLERALVGLADLGLRPLTWTRRTVDAGAPIRRILLLRLERIGDLLMVLDAIGEAAAAWPQAEIDLAVGSWNVPLARLLPAVHRVHTLDVPWLAREGTGAGWPHLIRAARAWRGRDYDLVINFEPDIRSNVLGWLSGAPRRVGYESGGGGSLLTQAMRYDRGRHVRENARALVASATGRRVEGAHVPPHPALNLPPEAHEAAGLVIGDAGRPIVGVHPSGGRESKQWHLDRFAKVARHLALERHATIVVTGSPADRALAERVLGQLADVHAIDAVGTLDLPALAALLGRLDVLVTGDTGPMHLAAAVGTPVVALFGPSDPRRYGPVSATAEILRVDLPCSPCGQVRLPPERCRGHVPDCMDGITVEAVVAAATRLLDAPGRISAS